MGDEDVDQAKIGVKLFLLVIITVIALWGRRRPSVPTGTRAAVGALTVLNVVVAVVWQALE
jgi:hypothetical protein